MPPWKVQLLPAPEKSPKSAWLFPALWSHNPQNRGLQWLVRLSSVRKRMWPWMRRQEENIQGCKQGVRSDSNKQREWCRECRILRSSYEANPCDRRSPAYVDNNIVRRSQFSNDFINSVDVEIGISILCPLSGIILVICCIYHRVKRHVIPIGIVEAHFEIRMEIVSEHEVEV